MLKVGLTGGLASGKSFVASCFEALGARVVQADELGHQVLLADGEAYGEVVAAFGPGILDPDGAVDRKSLGAIVFANPEELKQLNSIVHPHVFARQERFFERAAAEDPHVVAVVEAAIMIEIGSYKRYRRIVLADCPLETQIARFIHRSGGSREQALERINRQMPLEQKREYADYLVDTSGSKRRTREQAAQVYVKLEAEAQVSSQ